MPTSKPTYREYEQRRLGHSVNQLAGIAVMFRRAFGSSTFAGFWRYWNPLFSYYLYYYCYKPLDKFLPRSLVVIGTFTVSGTIHDFVASIMLLEIYILFSPVFTFWGLLVVGEEVFSLNFSRTQFWSRVIIYATIIIGTVVAGLKIRSLLT